MEVCESTEEESILMQAVEEDIEDGSQVDLLYWSMLMGIR